MMLSFSLMGAALLGFVCVPSYHQIGVWAPILAVSCRLVQGFAWAARSVRPPPI